MTDTRMTKRVTTLAEETGPVDATRFAADIATRYRPIVMRGQATAWPAVEAGRRSDEAMADYIRGFASDKPAEVLIGPPEIGGRFFYAEGMEHCNFQKRHGSLDGLLAKLLSLKNAPDPISLYAGAAATGDYLPGWSEENRLPFDLPRATARVWIGNATHVATHFDEASNVAVVATGKRRFTLFPPEQFANLYVGPFHFTVAGPPVSMVNLEAPDLDRYPRFADAIEHGVVAELDPGDAIFIPALWWHEVRATAAFNVLVNYWWDEAESASGIGAMIHAIMAIRDLPPGPRAAWRAWFDHYVFGDEARTAGDHLPRHQLGALAPPSPARNAWIRQQLFGGPNGGA